MSSLESSMGKSYREQMGSKNNTLTIKTNTRKSLSYTRLGCKYLSRKLLFK